MGHISCTSHIFCTALNREKVYLLGSEKYKYNRQSFEHNSMICRNCSKAVTYWVKPSIDMSIVQPDEHANHVMTLANIFLQ